MDYLHAKVTEVQHPAPGYAFLRFRGHRPVKGTPGQFVMVRGLLWGDDPILPRAFSLVEAGNSGAVLVRVVGKGTKRLAEMRSGDTLSVLGPKGHGFSHPERGERPVLVAGGVGVAPLVFAAESLARAHRDTTFIYGARTVAELPLSERLAETAELIQVTEDGSQGERGLVTAPLERLVQSGERLRILACGPAPMLRAVAEIAGRAAVPCEVALESPMACGIGSCKGCAVPRADGGYLYVCSDGPVFDSREIYGGAH